MSGDAGALVHFTFGKNPVPRSIFPHRLFWMFQDAHIGQACPEIRVVDFAYPLISPRGTDTTFIANSIEEMMLHDCWLWCHTETSHHAHVPHCPVTEWNMKGRSGLHHRSRQKSVESTIPFSGSPISSIRPRE